MKKTIFNVIEGEILCEKALAFPGYFVRTNGVKSAFALEDESYLIIDLHPDSTENKTKISDDFDLGPQTEGIEGLYEKYRDMQVGTITSAIMLSMEISMCYSALTGFTTDRKQKDSIQQLKPSSVINVSPVPDKDADRFQQWMNEGVVNFYHDNLPFFEKLRAKKECSSEELRRADNIFYAR